MESTDLFKNDQIFFHTLKLTPTAQISPPEQKMSNSKFHHLIHSQMSEIIRDCFNFTRMPFHFHQNGHHPM